MKMIMIGAGRIKNDKNNMDCPNGIFIAI